MGLFNFALALAITAAVTLGLPVIVYFMMGIIEHRRIIGEKIVDVVLGFLFVALMAIGLILERVSPEDKEV